MRRKGHCGSPPPEPPSRNRYDGPVTTPPNPPAAGPFRRRLHAAALDHVADLQQAGDLPPSSTGTRDAARWIAGHGLLALQGHPDLPEEVGEDLAAIARRNLANNLLLVHRFQAVAEALVPLPVCPLKGIHLLDTVYSGDPQHRVLSDLDLLVREEDAQEAVGRLAALGYREGALSRRAARHWHERVLGDGQVTVELHTRLGVKHGRHTTWDEVAPVPATIHGRPVHRLDDATTLVHLVTHFVKHGPFVRLAWAEDVLRWAERTGTDGAEALEVARRLGAAPSFVAGVRALATVAGEDFLPAVPRRPPGTAGAVLAAHERWVWPQLSTHGSPPDPLACGPASTPWRRNLSALLLADGPRDALAFLAAKAGELAARRPPGPRSQASQGPGTAP